MATKWLECTVAYNPEATPNKQYNCTFRDTNRRDISVKTGSDQVYVEYAGPPGAPFLGKGHMRVELHDMGGTRAIVILPTRGTHGSNDASVALGLLGFTPPPQKKTLCLFRKRR